jgi:hypothetical protein
VGASFLTTGAETTPCKDGVSDPAIGGGGGAIGVATLVCALAAAAFASISSAIVASRAWIIIAVRIGPAPFLHDRTVACFVVVDNAGNSPWCPSLEMSPGKSAGRRSAREGYSMSNRSIVVLAALALASLTFASQVEAGQPQPSAVQRYWQNLKRELTSPSVAVPAQRNQPAAVTGVRG